MNSEVAWKQNWSETKKHFIDWWQRKGLLLSVGGDFPADPPHAVVADPHCPVYGYGTDEYCSNPELRAWNCCHWLSRQLYPCDNLPLAGFDLGPGTLSIYLGAKPVFDRGTVWYEPCLTDDDPSGYPPLRFDPQQRWWKITEASARECARLAQGKYMASFPDLVENIDTLASLRGTNQLLVDMADRPAWVEEKVTEINRAWFEVYQGIYDSIALADGSSAFGAFSLWGPGKTAKVQCDASAMFSPAMFDRFVAPAMTEQCEWLDYSMYHLDGSQCLCHLDSLLGIAALDAIEWTPDPSVPSGGNPHWYDLYRRILAAGKSVQVVGVRAVEVIPLLDAVGGKGVYINGVDELAGLAEAENLFSRVEQYR